jgi:SAM-dependent methyltransferase
VATDWSSLWRELAERDLMASPEGEGLMVERWRRIARQLDRGERQEPDALLDYVRGRLTRDMSVLDIGAGIGRWTVPLARTVHRLTAVEPLPAMRQVLLERVASHGLSNVAVVSAPWMEAETPRHDAAIAVHATYTTPDLLGFVGKMESSARACYLVLRVPVREGLIGELSERIHHRWHDSPNFVLGYNLLLASGRYPNVVMEPAVTRHWVDRTVDEAVARAKRHLKLDHDASDGAIRDLLSRKLTPVDGGYRWPDGMRSALVWWESRG